MTALATPVNLIAQARRLLADSNDESYEDADLLAFLNEGCQRFASETHVCQTITEVPVTSSKILFSEIVAENSKVEKVLQVVKIEVIDTAGDYFLDFSPTLEKTVRKELASTDPDRYSIFASSIIFNTNTAATLDLTMNIYHSYKPIEVTNSAVDIAIPAEWEQAIVKYIVFCGLIMVRDSGGANGAFAEYAELRTAAIANVIARMG